MTKKKKVVKDVKPDMYERKRNFVYLTKKGKKLIDDIVDTLCA